MLAIGLGFFALSTPTSQRRVVPVDGGWTTPRATLTCLGALSETTFSLGIGVIA
jgi:hypothetical protein